MPGVGRRRAGPVGREFRQVAARRALRPTGLFSVIRARVRRRPDLLSQLGRARRNRGGFEQRQIDSPGHALVSRPVHVQMIARVEFQLALAALGNVLDRDHDGTLDLRELRGRLTARELRAADPDRDNTLTKDEYLALVEKRFNAANPDHDGTVDAKELKTRAGRALLRLLR